MSFGAGVWGQHQQQGGWTNNGWGMPHHGWTNNEWDSGPQKAERQKAKVRLQAGVCIGCACGIFVIGIVGLLILAANSWFKKTERTDSADSVEAGENYMGNQVNNSVTSPQKLGHQAAVIPHAQPFTQTRNVWTTRSGARPGLTNTAPSPRIPQSAVQPERQPPVIPHLPKNEKISAMTHDSSQTLEEEPENNETQQRNPLSNVVHSPPILHDAVRPNNQWSLIRPPPEKEGVSVMTHDSFQTLAKESNNNAAQERNPLSNGAHSPPILHEDVQSNNQWSLISPPPEKEEVSVMTHDSWEILERVPQTSNPSRVRTYTPRADHLRKTAGLLDQGRNGTCFLAAFARTVARMSVWLEVAEGVVRCEEDLRKFNTEIKTRAEKLLTELEIIMVDCSLGYERLQDDVIDLIPGMGLMVKVHLSSCQSALTDLWQRYLGCDRIFVGDVPPGAALRVQREVGVVFGVGNVPRHAVCLEEKGSSAGSYIAVQAHANRGSPDLPDAFFLSASAPKTGDDAGFCHLQTETVIMPSWDEEETQDGGRSDGSSRMASQLGLTSTKRGKLKLLKDSICNCLNGNAKAVVATQGDNLRFFSPEVRDNFDIVLAAVTKDGNALRFASKKLQENREIVRKAVQNVGGSLEFASESLRNDRDVVLAAVTQNANALRLASETLKGDAEFVLEAVKQKGSALCFASPELRGDTEFVQEAVEMGSAIEFAGGNAQEEYLQASADVQKDGMALQGLPSHLRKDVDLVGFAVNQDGRAIQFALGSARENFGIQLDALWGDPSTFMNTFRNDPRVIKEVLVALQKSGAGRVSLTLTSAVERCGELLAYIDQGADVEFSLVLARAAVQADANAKKYVIPSLKERL